MTPEIREAVRNSPAGFPPELFTWVLTPMPEQDEGVKSVDYGARAPFQTTAMVRPVEGQPPLVVYILEPPDPDEFADYWVTGGRSIGSNMLHIKPYVDDTNTIQVACRFKDPAAGNARINALAAALGRSTADLMGYYEMLPAMLTNWYQDVTDIGGGEAYAPTKQKAKKGQRMSKPLYEWTTLKIAPRKNRMQHETQPTGRHKRNHPVRGYWNTSKYGKKFWVPAHRSGRGDGYLFHDYVVGK